MLTPQERDRIVDYFEPWELALWLKVSIEDFVEYFEDEIEDKITDLNEFMGYKDDPA